MIKPSRRSSAELPLHRFHEYATLSPREIAEIKALGAAPISCRKGEVIRREGETPEHIFLLVEGWVAASVELPDDGRQIVKLHLPGDLLGTPSMSMAETAETLQALTPATVRAIRIEEFGRLLASTPQLAMVMFLSAQRERVALMDGLARLGKRSAARRVASLLLDISERLNAVGQEGETGFALPLTQEQIGSVLGLTGVHVNRTLRELEANRLIDRRLQHVTIRDRTALEQLAGWVTRRPAGDLPWIPAPA